MNVLDVVIIVAAIAFGFGGFRRGAIVGFCSTVGFFAGALGGAQLARPIGSSLASGRSQVLIAIACVLLLAMVGQLLGGWIAGHIKRRLISHETHRVFDSGVGSAFGVVSVLLVAWMIGVPLRVSSYPTLSDEAEHSAIVGAVDDVMPGGVRELYGSLREFLDRSGFPPFFGDLTKTPDVKVAAPPHLSTGLRRMVTARQRSVVKIYGDASQCGRRIEGTGFVYARRHIVTNAHVVAGADRVTVEVVGRQQPVTATVVLFDPATDVAVLYAPGLDVQPLPIASGAGKDGSPAVVLGYPKDGPFTIETARIRSKFIVSTGDIYGAGQHRREIYAVRSTIKSGNSGGPLLSVDGQVLGVVFATARDRPDTGFVLTNAAVKNDYAAGRTATAEVATQSCIPG